MAESTMSDQERNEIIEQIRGRARKKVRARKGLAWHALVFSMANGAMYSINQTYSPEHQWFVWPLSAWGAGLLLHTASTFGGQSTTDALVEAEVQRELQRRGLV